MVSLVKGTRQIECCLMALARSFLNGFIVLVAVKEMVQAQKLFDGADLYVPSSIKSYLDCFCFADIESYTLLVA